MKIIRYIPNTLTILRIIGTVIMLFLSPISIPFYIVYTLSGISDVLDGVIARKANCTSNLGSVLDSIADMLFYAVMLYCMMPLLIESVPTVIWYWIVIILVIRLGAYTVAAIKFHCFASIHTYFNKATGLTLFLAPYALMTSYFDIYCVVICVVATLACIEELIIHISSNEYEPTRQSILLKK